MISAEVSALVKNSDLVEQTGRKYIVGSLYEALSRAGLVQHEKKAASRRVAEECPVPSCAILSSG